MAPNAKARRSEPNLSLDVPPGPETEPADHQVQRASKAFSESQSLIPLPGSCRGSTPNSHQGDSPQFKVIFAPSILKISHMPQFSFSGGLR